MSAEFWAGFLSASVSWLSIYFLAVVIWAVRDAMRVDELPNVEAVNDRGGVMTKPNYVHSHTWQDPA